MSRIPQSEFQEILLSLLENHSIFYKFWSVCRPQYSDTVDTAAVSFDKEHACISFVINPVFWTKASQALKKFIICHECMHIINFHAKRIKNNFTPQANHAMDIVVNESLVKYFNFNRSEVDKNSEFCWMDTVFRPEQNVQPWYNFEYYLNILNQDAPLKKCALINNHNGLNSIPDNFLSDFVSSFSEDEKNTIKYILEDSEKKSLQAGDHSGNLSKQILETNFSHKRKWETIIHKFQKKIKLTRALSSHWLNKPRRLYGLKNELFIPSDTECKIKKSISEKISTWFFLDTSGSCWHLSDRFFKAAKSLDPKIFDVQYFYFDTQVFKADIRKSRDVFGGGGTSFSCIANYIKSKNEDPYVWVITDGFGDSIKIQENKQHKWSWFLTENSSKSHIPSKCKIYKLSDFE
jgi:predicted metal-dependent peptidase